MFNDLKFRNRKTGDIVTAYELFINDYSDAGAASIGTTLLAIEKDYEIVPKTNWPRTKRRTHMQEWGEIEHSISRCIQMIEQLEANTLLTEAQILLDKAQDKVCRYFEEKEAAQNNQL